MLDAIRFRRGRLEMRVVDRGVRPSILGRIPGVMDLESRRSAKTEPFTEDHGKDT